VKYGDVSVARLCVAEADRDALRVLLREAILWTNDCDDRSDWRERACALLDEQFERHGEIPDEIVDYYQSTPTSKEVSRLDRWVNRYFGTLR